METSSLQKLYIQGETNSEAETSLKEFIAYCEYLERQGKSSQVNQNFYQGAITLPKHTFGTFERGLTPFFL